MTMRRRATTIMMTSELPLLLLLLLIFLAVPSVVESRPQQQEEEEAVTATTADQPPSTAVVPSERIRVSAAQDALLRIQEKLSSDTVFRNQWLDLVHLQSEQQSSADSDATARPPWDEKLEVCAVAPIQARDTDANSLSPADIQIYADIGHLSIHCSQNYTALKEGVVDFCESHGRASPTNGGFFASFLSAFNSNLTYVTNPHPLDTLANQVKEVIANIQALPDYENRWKFVLIAASIQDGEASETGQTAVAVLDAIEQLGRHLPRTFVVVIRSSSGDIWKQASRSHAACQSMLATWKLHSTFNSDSVWDQVEVIAQNNFRHSDFNVEILELLNDAQLDDYGETHDLSVLGYDCAHLSARGLSLLQTAAWNSLFTSTLERPTKWRAAHDTAVCPDSRCPFFRTRANSESCLWSPREAPASFDRAFWTAVGGFAAAIVIFLIALIVLLCICCRTPRTKPAAKQSAFGSSLSSIKFIDEDNNMEF